jgi:hypothetical protein
VFRNRIFCRIWGGGGVEGVETEDGRICSCQQHTAYCPVACCVSSSADLWLLLLLLSFVVVKQ